jgi:hypothetical protein
MQCRICLENKGELADTLIAQNVGNSELSSQLGVKLADVFIHKSHSMDKDLAPCVAIETTPVFTPKEVKTDTPLLSKQERRDLITGIVDKLLTIFNNGLISGELVDIPSSTLNSLLKIMENPSLCESNDANDAKMLRDLQVNFLTGMRNDDFIGIPNPRMLN